VLVRDRFCPRCPRIRRRPGTGPTLKKNCQEKDITGISRKECSRSAVMTNGLHIFARFCPPRPARRVSNHDVGTTRPLPIADQFSSSGSIERGGSPESAPAPPPANHAARHRGANEAERTLARRPHLFARSCRMVTAAAIGLAPRQSFGGHLAGLARPRTHVSQAAG
jgi:hypothetical protein